ncbi:MAG: TIGR00266 family protein [Candidatus Thermoplasmatota archaeon]|nr:TIGR00266 family protein [Candidatus Thermoplasmatota archaeon]MEC7425778.1 TIGR00266 family protein [Candidatus Thermoplasmatota archaeon]MEC7459147.1 TIGR00266 family protein [Candidatus Thermoplasmatota archaeon]MEC8170810.1 TIGR00266 family protein [Candidatus Thermoplasmatota archaeon]MEC9136391.1 TIGR00266 family protein [Candidatus Thermoplasmatota archaeon]
MEIESEYGPAFTMMTANLAPGEKIKVEPGAMVAQSEGLEMKTGMGSGGGLGGFMKSMMKSAFGGESFFVNTYTAGPSGGWISLAPSSPGDIETFDMEPGQSFYMQGGAFMASTINVDTSTKFQGAKSLFSREGAFFLRAEASDVPGKVFFTSYGAMKEIEVTPDKPIKIDNGHVVAFSEGLNYHISKVKGLGSFFFGGEGFTLDFHGSGSVWIQTRNIESLANQLIPFLPTRSQ